MSENEKTAKKTPAGRECVIKKETPFSDVDLLLVALANTHVQGTEFPGAIVTFDCLDMLDPADRLLTHRAGCRQIFLLGLVQEGLFLGHR